MKFAAFAFAAIAVIAIGSLLTIVLIPGFLCENTLVEEVLSPNGEMKVVIFQRECSSSQDYTTQVSILPTNANLPSGVGNIFIANNGAAPRSASGSPLVKVQWRDDAFVELSHHQAVRVFLSEPALAEISVEYAHNDQLM